ncbi:MAG: hypothetical protein ABIP51_08275, partial [Bacteroidia bacterium]
GGGNWSSGGSNNNNNGSIDNDDSQGMNCYYMIYDKQEQKMCYLNSASFKSDKTDNNPFNSQRVSNQVERIFHSCVK